MNKKEICDSLTDYNLMLLRKIYDAYEDRADKVLKQFRDDKHNVLRKRYMTPIVNPNYDFEKFAQELRASQAVKEEVDEDEVHLSGETLGEDAEQMVMDALREEGEDLVKSETATDNGR